MVELQRTCGIFGRVYEWACSSETLYRKTRKELYNDREWLSFVLYLSEYAVAFDMKIAPDRMEIPGCLELSESCCLKGS